MSSDFESYEQDFAVLTAEITGRIGKVPKLEDDGSTNNPIVTNAFSKKCNKGTLILQKQ